ncbi:MAG TPA: sulfotransferase [Dongiaceae bacterium]|nr:sulfotransferase [Dongiaceae bacterium]
MDLFPDDRNPAILRRRRKPTAPLAKPAVVLVRGCPRSGTTVIASMINASPKAAMMYEYPLDALVRDLRPILAHQREIESMWERAPEGFALTPLEAEGAYFNDFGDPPYEHYPTDERFGAIVTAVVEATVGKRDVTVIGSKTPGSVLMDERAAIEPYFGDIRYLFVVREPLATINSMMNRRNLTRIGADRWDITDVDGAIAEYRRSVLSLFSHVAAYPDACYVVKYEDLVERDVETLTGIEDFLDVPLMETRRLLQRETETRVILDADERGRVARAFGGVTESWSQKALTGPGARAVEALTDCVVPLVPGTRYRYVSAGGQRHFLGAGWNALEEGGVWSARPEADLFFTVAESGEFVVSVEFSCFLVGDQTAKSVGVALNGARLFHGTALASESPFLDATNGDVRVFAAPGPFMVLGGPVALEAGRVNRLVLGTDDARSPLQLGVSEDPRSLGVYLHGLMLTGDAGRRTAANGAANGRRLQREPV